MIHDAPYEKLLFGLLPKEAEKIAYEADGGQRTGHRYELAAKQQMAGITKGEDKWQEPLDIFAISLRRILCETNKEDPVPISGHWPYTPSRGSFSIVKKGEQYSIDAYSSGESNRTIFDLATAATEEEIRLDLATVLTMAEGYLSRQSGIPQQSDSSPAVLALKAPLFQESWRKR